MERLPCITLHQPWASWIGLGWKTIETRTHGQFHSLVGKRIGIHAGKTWDRLAYIKAGDFLTLEQIHETEELRRFHGVIVCTAVVRELRRLTTEDSKASLCDARGLYGLVLEDKTPHVFSNAPQVLGQQGVWFYPSSR